jgi:hypothetical protein
MLEFCTFIGTPLLVATIQCVYDLSSVEVFAMWAYVFGKALLGVLPLCVKDVHCARRTLECLVGLLWVLDTVGVCVLGITKEYPPWAMAVLLLLAALFCFLGFLHHPKITCVQGIGTSPQEWHSAFRMESSDNCACTCCVFLLSSVWLLFLDIVTLVLGQEVYCVHPIIVHVIFICTMVCWCVTSLLLLCTCGARAPFRTKHMQQSTHALLYNHYTETQEVIEVPEVPDVTDVWAIDLNAIKRLKVVYFGFGALFLYFTVVCFAHLAWSQDMIYASTSPTLTTLTTSLNSTSYPLLCNASNHALNQTQIEDWALINLFTTMLSIPTLVLLVVNFGISIHMSCQ